MPEDVPDIEVSFRSALFRESLSNRSNFATGLVVVVPIGADAKVLVLNAILGVIRI